MNKHTILIVEDEDNISEVLVAYCEREGYHTKLFTTGHGVAEYVRDNQVSLVLLDLMLPEVDGLTVCKQIRGFSETPIIMTTAKIEEIDRLLGLELGADDYICKPFSPREVIARIKAVLRRMHFKPEETIIKHEFELAPDQYRVSFQGKAINFTPIEFKIFALFFNNIGRVYSRDDIMNQAYDDNAIVSDRNIDTHIKNIRKKISAEGADASMIASVYGVGYKMEMPS